MRSTPSTQRNDDTQLLYTACPVNSCSAICLALGSKRKDLAPSDHVLLLELLDIVLLQELLDSPVLEVRTRPATSPILNLQTVASHQSCFLLVSCRCCTRCFLCTQLSNLGIKNLSTPSGPKHQFSLATFEPLWKMQPLSPYKKVTPPIVVYSPTDNSGLHTGA